MREKYGAISRTESQISKDLGVSKENMIAARIHYTSERVLEI